MWKNRLLPSSHTEAQALREAGFKSRISKQGFITPHFLQKPAWATRKLLKNILSTFCLRNVDLPKMRHSKEVQTSNLFPAFLPGKFSGTSWHLAWGSFFEFASPRASTPPCHWNRSLAAMVLLGDLDLLAGMPSEVNDFRGNRETGICRMDPTRNCFFLRCNFTAVHPAGKYSIVKYTAMFRDWK